MEKLLDMIRPDDLSDHNISPQQWQTFLSVVKQRRQFYSEESTVINCLLFINYNYYISLFSRCQIRDCINEAQIVKYWVKIAVRIVRLFIQYQLSTSEFTNKFHKQQHSHTFIYRKVEKTQQLCVKIEDMHKNVLESEWKALEGNKIR